MSWQNFFIFDFLTNSPSKKDVEFTKIIVPPGCQTRKMDNDVVGKYSGRSKLSNLEHWLHNLAVVLEADQYSGPDCDHKHVLQILNFLTSEAKTWYHPHIFSVSCCKLSWTFEDVITGLHIDLYIPRPWRIQGLHFSPLVIVKKRESKVSMTPWWTTPIIWQYAPMTIRSSRPSYEEYPWAPIHKCSRMVYHLKSTQ